MFLGFVLTADAKHVVLYITATVKLSVVVAGDSPTEFEFFLKNASEFDGVGH